MQNKSASLKECEANHYCPAGTKGDFSSALIKNNSSNSHSNADGKARLCPVNSSSAKASYLLSHCLGNAGYFNCQQDASNPECEQTTPGYYSAAGTNERKNCDVGKYCETEGLGSPTAYCAAGYYCLSNSTSSKGKRNNSSELKCRAGYYCPEASYNSYGFSLVHGHNHKNCQAGYYCPQASADQYGRTLEEQSSEENKKICAEGRYCLSNSTTENGSGPCSAGYYCSKGSYDSVGRNINDSSIKYCENDHYCPSGTKGDDSQSSRKNSSSYSHVEGDGLARLCPENSQANQGSSALSDCKGDAGYFNCQQNTSNPECEQTAPGYYSVAGSNERKDCDAGKYCETTGLGSPTADCAAGFYCPSLSQTEEGAGKCNAGYYCSPGSASASQYSCPSNYYCHEGTKGDSSGNPIKNDNYNLFVDTAANFCHPNSKSLIRSDESTDCLAKAGFYLEDSSGNAYYDVGENINPCAETYHYQNEEGKTSCKSISSGYKKLNNSSQTLCDRGHKCEGDGFEIPCNPGTYQANTGKDFCSDAGAGYYVDGSGSSSQKACSPGTYQPSTGMSFCLSADAGNYVGTSTSSSQEPCSAGTYQPDVGQSSCLSADAGNYVEYFGKLFSKSM